MAFIIGDTFECDDVEEFRRGLLMWAEFHKEYCEEGIPECPEKEEFYKGMAWALGTVVDYLRELKIVKPNKEKPDA